MRPISFVSALRSISCTISKSGTPRLLGSANNHASNESVLKRKELHGSYLDAHDVWNTFSNWMFSIYATFRGDIEQMQREDTNYYTDFCALLERLRTIEHEEGSDSDRPSREEIKEFWQDEAAIVPGSPLKRRKRAKTNSPTKADSG
jgi:hypothetical protein